MCVITYLISSKKGKRLTIFPGKLAEYDEPMSLMKREESLFRKLVKEYWSHFQSAESH
jgi:ATP-binding cassette subfamily C (CFTR/MRP) protein 2